MKTLNAQHSKLADTHYQLELLDKLPEENPLIVPFDEMLHRSGMRALKPTGIDILQVNVGKMCNQTCKHCHVDAGPDRTEIMTQTTMQQCLDVLIENDIPCIDLTGGAPEMNPDFRWFVEQCAAAGKKIIVRCNLTIIVANKKYHDLPSFFKKHHVEVVSSLPFYHADKTDRQRGEGVFAKSITALKMLNEVGYGIAGSGLILNLVYNPAGAFLPDSQHSLQAKFTQSLYDEHGIHFNELFAITNLPVSRFLDFLISTENYHEYMQKLVNAFNPKAAEGVMCRNTLSVGWDGFIYDCDFNQMLDMKIGNGKPFHISKLDMIFLANREIATSQHCYGCTAGAGSSCGGEVVK